VKFEAIEASRKILRGLARMVSRRGPRLKRPSRQIFSNKSVGRHGWVGPIRGRGIGDSRVCLAAPPNSGRYVIGCEQKPLIGTFSRSCFSSKWLIKRVLVVLDRGRQLPAGSSMPRCWSELNHPSESG